MYIKVFLPSSLFSIYYPHLLFQIILAVVDRDGIIVTVQAMDKRLDGGFVKMANVAGDLPRLLAQKQCLGIDETEGIDNDFALDALNRVNHYGHGTRIQLLKTL